MTVSNARPDSEKPKSRLGLVLCSVIAALIYPFLFVLGWVTASPLYQRKDLVGLFTGLRDGAYFLLSGRMFRSMVLHHPNPPPDAKR